MNEYMKKNIVTTLQILVLLIVVSSAYFLSQRNRISYTSEEIGTLAECLREKGVRFYGAFWCGHCQDQKKAFGEYADRLPYIECSEPDGRTQTAVCRENDINSYPTWVFPEGSQAGGRRSFADLAERSGCEI